MAGGAASRCGVRGELVDLGRSKPPYNSSMVVDPKERIGVPESVLADFCERWKITELAVFGSALRDDFGPESDIDFLVTFADDAAWSLLDYVEMEEEMAALVGRPVDVIERRAVEQSENYIRRRHILGGERVKPRRDDALLLDILISARKAISYLESVGQDELEGSELLQSAILWHLGAIARSAQKASHETKQASPQIPWAKLVHVPPGSRLWLHYSPDKIWEMVNRTLPPLVAVLESLVEPDEPQTVG